MKTREQIERELEEYLKDHLYVCTRSPEAWQYGTMTLEDFVPAWDDWDIIESILEICEVK